VRRLVAVYLPRTREIATNFADIESRGQLEQSRERVLARINGPAKVGTLPAGNNSFSNPYRPNLVGDCCTKGQNTTAPPYVLRP